MESENRQNHAGSPDPETTGSWLDELLPPTELGAELAPDEEAVSAAGLIHPSDAQVEQIIRETRAEEAEAAQPEPIPEAEPFRDEDYRDAFGDGESLNAVFEEDAAPQPPEPPEQEGAQPARKRRPRRKKGYGLLGIPHILATVVWIAIIVAVGVSLGRMVWLCAADVLAFGRENREISFEVSETDTVESIAQRLKDKGLIRYPKLFELYADLSDAEEKITPGSFKLNTLYDYHALVNGMTEYAEGREIVTVTVPEGYTCRQLFALLEEEGVCSAADLEEYAANGEIEDYWFLEGVPRGDKYCLEGFLFPDTYDFYVNEKPQRVLEKFLDAFDDRVDGMEDKDGLTLRDKLPALNEHLSALMAANGYGEDYIAQHQMTVRDVVTVASMIEKESAGSVESPTVASVIYNRLTNQAAYPFLNIDATIYYALGGKSGALTSEDLLIDSPYNTYTNAGLIPGPICNPSRNSLAAAISPEDTDYYYYALDPSSGLHHFSETGSEHEAFLASLG